MLTRSDLQALQSHRDYPSISILAPTHRSAPRNKQDPIKVKNLVKKAVERLHGEFKKREVADIVQSLQELVKNVDWQHTLDGLALFAGRGRSASVNLPFRVKPRALIDEIFATRDIVYTLNRARPYRVLVLSHTVNLYEGWTNVLELHTAKPFPLEHRAKLTSSPDVNSSALRDDAMRTFFKGVDDAVAAVQKTRSLPLVVVGVDRNLAFFREVTSQANAVVGMLAGNHDKTSPRDLGKLVWPIVDAGGTVQRTEALVQLDQAVGANRLASGPDAVWLAATRGQVRTLLVEKTYKFAADVSPDGTQLVSYTGKGAQALDDAVGETIDRVVVGGGEVYFYGDDDLEAHQRIAAVLRS